MVVGSAKFFSSLVFYLRKSQQILTKKMRLPERWLDYSRVGEKIKGIPIICFKTPLSEQFSIEYSPKFGYTKEEEFKPSQVPEEVQKKGYNLGLVIDLTNTFKYYDGKKEFEQDQGIRYLKLKFNGYDPECFSQVFETFANTIDDFLTNRPNDDIIGVHCTHGLNRTGYLVCRYMIDVLNYEPKDAIQLFNKARGYSIEKECFLKDLPLRWMERNQGNEEFDERFKETDDFINSQLCSKVEDLVIKRGHAIEYSETRGARSFRFGDERKKYVDNWEYYPDPNEHGYYHDYGYNDWRGERSRNRQWNRNPHEMQHKSSRMPENLDRRGQGSWNRSGDPYGRLSREEHQHGRDQESYNTAENYYGRRPDSWNRSTNLYGRQARQGNQHGMHHESWNRPGNPRNPHGRDQTTQDIDSSYQRPHNSWQTNDMSNNERSYYNEGKYSRNKNRGNSRRYDSSHSRNYGARNDDFY